MGYRVIVERRAPYCNWETLSRRVYDNMDEALEKAREAYDEMVVETGIEAYDANINYEEGWYYASYLGGLAMGEEFKIETVED